MRVAFSQLVWNIIIILIVAICAIFLYTKMTRYTDIQVFTAERADDGELRYEDYRQGGIVSADDLANLVHDDPTFDDVVFDTDCYFIMEDYANTCHYSIGQYLSFGDTLFYCNVFEHRFTDKSGGEEVLMVVAIDDHVKQYKGFKNNEYCRGG